MKNLITKKMKTDAALHTMAGKQPPACKPWAVAGLLLLAIFWLGLVSPKTAFAEDIRTPQIHVLIDVSGSMRWTDPDNLRDPATRLLGDLLPPEARIGMWFFGNEITPVLSPRLADSEAKSVIRQVARNIRSDEPWTDIPEALVAADRHWHENTDRNIILLSDGMVDISPDEAVNRRATERMFLEIIPGLVENDIRVHTIALSDEADTTVLEQIANRTGGMKAVAKTDADLQRAFMDLFEAAAPRVGLPLVENRFAVDEHVEELTLLVFREPDAEPTRIQLPDERTLGQADGEAEGWRWDAAAGRDLITIENPPPGRWAILAETDPDNRAMIITDLSIRMKNLPSRIYPGEILDSSLVLVNHDQTLSTAELTENLAASVRVEDRASKAVFNQELNDLGRPPDILGGDGRFDYQLMLDETAGTYTVVVEATGPTFSRVYKQRIALAPSAPLLMALDGHYVMPEQAADAEVDADEPPADPDWQVDVALNFDPTVIEEASPVFSGRWNCPGQRRESIELALEQTPTILTAPLGFYGPDCVLEGEITARVQENRSITMPINRPLPEPEALTEDGEPAEPEEPVSTEPAEDNLWMAMLIGFVLLFTMGLFAVLLKTRAAKQRAELIQQAHAD